MNLRYAYFKLFAIETFVPKPEVEMGPKKVMKAMESGLGKPVMKSGLGKPAMKSALGKAKAKAKSSKGSWKNKLNKANLEKLGNMTLYA